MWLCNCSTLNFLIYEENSLFFFISVLNRKQLFLCYTANERPVGIQYKCLVLIYVFPVKLLFPKQNYIFPGSVCLFCCRKIVNSQWLHTYTYLEALLKPNIYPYLIIFFSLPFLGFFLNPEMLKGRIRIRSIVYHSGVQIVKDWP